MLTDRPNCTASRQHVLIALGFCLTDILMSSTLSLQYLLQSWQQALIVTVGFACRMALSLFVLCVLQLRSALATSSLCPLT